MPKEMRIKQCPITCQFRIEIRLFRQLFEAVNNIIHDRCSLKLDPEDGLFMRAISSEQVVLVELELKTACLEEFICSEPCEWFIPVKQFLESLQFMDSGRETTHLWFQACGEQPEQLYIRRMHPSFAWIDLNLMSPTAEVPPLSKMTDDRFSQGTVILHSETWNRIIDYLNDFGEMLQLSVKDDELRIIVKEKLSGVEYKISDRESKFGNSKKIMIDLKDKEIETHSYSSEHIKAFSKAFKVSNTAELRFFPSLLKVTYAVKTEHSLEGSSRLTYFIGKRVQDDD